MFSLHLKYLKKHHFQRVRPFVHPQFEWDIDLGRPFRRRSSKGLTLTKYNFNCLVKPTVLTIEVVKWRHCVALCIFWRYNDTLIAHMRTRMQSRFSTSGDNCAFKLIRLAKSGLGVFQQHFQVRFFLPTLLILQIGHGRGRGLGTGSIFSRPCVSQGK